MTGFISDADASDNEQVDIGRIHSQAMVLNKRSPAFLEGTKQAITQNIRRMLEALETQQRHSMEKQQAFEAEIARVVDASLETGLAQREYARALIAPQGPLERVLGCYQDAEEILARADVQSLEETYVLDRAQTVEVLAAGKRVVARSLAGGQEAVLREEEGDGPAALIFRAETGREGQTARGAVEEGLEVIEKMVKKATKLIPKQ